MIISHPSITYLVGIPETGKTTKGIEIAATLSQATGFPIGVINSEGVKNLRGFPMVYSLAEVAHALWTERRHVQFVPDESDLAPGQPAEPEVIVEAFFNVARRLKRVIVLVDEFSYWASAYKEGDSLGRILRAYRHQRDGNGEGPEGLSLVATSQYIGDFSPLARTCAKFILAFRNTDSRALDRLAEKGFDSAILKKLEKGEFLVWSAWGGVEPPAPPSPGPPPA